MDYIETTITFIEAIEKSDWFTVESVLAEDFRYFGPFPDPCDRDTWLAYVEAVGNAIPDLSLGLNRLEAKGEEVHFVVHLTGTHTKELKLPTPGIHPIAATSIHIDLPSDKAKVRFENDRIVELHSTAKLHTGLLGILEKLNVAT